MKTLVEHFKSFLRKTSSKKEFSKSMSAYKPENKRAKYVPSKGWVVEENKGGRWVRIYTGLPKHEAYWVAYGEII